jgi:hypothetical protein
MARILQTFLVALCVLTPAWADDARIRAEVEAAMADMSKAVLAADQKAFLARVDSTDKHFYAEQTHWSDELAKYTPTEFALSIGEGDRRFTDAAAEFPLVMSWRFDNGRKDNWGTDPKGRKVVFPTVVFTKRDGRWLYCGEKWKEIYAPDGSFVVRFLAGSDAVAEDVVKAFPAAKAHVDTEFQRLVKDRQVLTLYKSMDHLKATVYMNMPDGYLGGWSEAGESIKFMDSYTRTVAGWTAAYAHEYGHVATWELGPHARKIRWWVQEGVAELCAGKYRPGYALRLDGDMKRRAADRTLAEWSAISDYLTAEQRFKQLAYTQGDHMNSFITTKWKREGRNKWLTAMGGGKSLEEATKEVLGLSFAELDKLWREALAAEPAPEATGKAAPTVEPAGLRDAIGQLLKDMTAAVGGADQKRYLSLVSRADPVFLKEQENWAADLGRKAPEFVEMLLDTPADEPALRMDGDQAAIGRMTTKWRMPNGKDRTISFPVRFVKSEQGWLYAGEHWNVHKGEKSLVMYEDEAFKEVAAAVAEVLPEIRAHVDEGFEHFGNEAVTGAVQQVKLYSSVRHLQHSIYLSYTDGLAGWNEPGEAIKILANPRSRTGSLRVLLGHEYGHVATFFLGPKSNEMAWWILEGIAELSATKFSRNSAQVDRMVKAWAKTGKLIEWEKLSDFRGEAANHGLNVYNQGHHMIAFIAETFTRPKLNAWMKAMSTGDTLDEATRRVLGLTFAELDAKWRESLADSEPPARQRE